MDEELLQKEQADKIEAWLQSVKFRRQTIGGLDERDVWTKIRQLDDIYKEALLAERARYDALLAEQKRGVDGT